MFLALTLVLPLALVFHEAFAKGLATYWQAITDPDALSAARLTLLVAAIAVPAQPGLRRGRGLVHHQVRLSRARTC